jgi:hypothetical protein
MDHLKAAALIKFCVALSKVQHALICVFRQSACTVLYDGCAGLCAATSLTTLTITLNWVMKLLDTVMRRCE